jgi:hypothetical protein
VGGGGGHAFEGGLSGRLASSRAGSLIKTQSKSLRNTETNTGEEEGGGVTLRGGGGSEKDEALQAALKASAAEEEAARAPVEAEGAKKAKKELILAEARGAPWAVCFIILASSVANRLSCLAC